MQQDWGIIFAFGLYFFSTVRHRDFPYEKKEQDLAGYVLGGRKVEAMGLGNECRSLRYERLDADGIAGLCVCSRCQRILDRYRLGNRNLAELAVCG